MFSSINVSVLGVVDALKGYVAAKWLDFQGWFKPRFACCKATIEARTARTQFAVLTHCALARVAAAPHVITVRERFRAAVDRLRPRVRALTNKVVAACRAVTAWSEMALHLTLAKKWAAP